MPRLSYSAALVMSLVLGTIGLNQILLANEPAEKADLVGHWPLRQDARDMSGHGHDAENHGVEFHPLPGSPAAETSAVFNGRDAFLEIPAQAAWDVGQADFSVAAWVHTEANSDDVPGDIISQYDPARRRGFQLSLKTNAGVTFSQANYRQLQFGIDDDRLSPWADCGRPGDAILAFALAVHDGQLYAGTCEPGATTPGRVYRYEGDQAWHDCGAPAACNAVTALAVYDGQLYAGTGKYRLAGSALSESENQTLGGQVFRYDGDAGWVDCGQLPGVEAVSGLVVFRGQLYAGSLYRPAGFFRYEGNRQWTDCGTPNGKRVEALAAYNGYLYATAYDEGHVYRYDGTAWTDCGQLGDSGETTQTYALAVLAGKLHVGTWRGGRVYRMEEADPAGNDGFPVRWIDVGRLGEELEVMGMLVHNGRLLAGTLPLAEVYSYEGGDSWRRLATLDATPDVKYRRVWTMAEFQGRLFCSTLPSGHIHACQAGQTAMSDRELSAGWRHVAAIRSSGELRLYVDGSLAARSPAMEGEPFDLASDVPLRIGLGSNDHFLGRLRDIRFYRRALNAAEIAKLAMLP